MKTSFKNIFTGAFRGPLGVAALKEQTVKDLILQISCLYKDFLFKGLPVPSELELSLMSELMGTQIPEALYIKNFLLESLKAPGDVCEFGIAQGATSAFLAYLIKNTDRQIWLFDSFHGLSKPTAKDSLLDDIFKLGSMEAYHGKMACDMYLAKERLKRIDFPESRTHIVPGFIEDTIKSKNLPKNVCFAYVDFDLYEPILITLNYLDKVMTKGTFIAVDDYEFFSTGVKTAVHEFMESNQDKYELILPVRSAGHFCILEKKL